MSVGETICYERNMEENEFEMQVIKESIFIFNSKPTYFDMNS